MKDIKFYLLFQTSKISICLLTLSLMLSFGSCIFTKPFTNKTAIYNEDLAAYRAELATFEVPQKKAPKENTQTNNTAGSTEEINNGNPPTSDVLALENMLSRIATSNSDLKSIPGYRIQLYSGSDVDRAREVRNKASYTLSRFGLRAETVYEQPLYKIRAGYFISQLDAQRQLASIKEEFSGAILVPASISMKLLRARYLPTEENTDESLEGEEIDDK